MLIHILLFFIESCASLPLTFSLTRRRSRKEPPEKRGGGGRRRAVEKRGRKRRGREIHPAVGKR